MNMDRHLTISRRRRGEYELLLYGKHSFWRIVQSDWSIWGPDFAVMTSAAVAGHYEIFNALQNSENTRLFLKKL